MCETRDIRMLGRGRGHDRTCTRGAGQAEPAPESQQAPQYLIDLMTPITARLVAFEDRVANQISPVVPPPVVPPTVVLAVPIAEASPAATPPVAIDKAAEQEA
ncbi:uncharacterized protein A4U43_C02F11340 [Asparagus officinalis]|uniref:Uncharacterized protein n=1 Tax=Asparagus officinalis TaxID=4686 RepID=A0A5P1FHI1_ASPOF|nr:uncharacterized protein A4U43_C02F11340 [Asparagus officinalis]